MTSRKIGGCAVSSLLSDVTLTYSSPNTVSGARLGSGGAIVTARETVIVNNVCPGLYGSVILKNDEETAPGGMANGTMDGTGNAHVCHRNGRLSGDGCDRSNNGGWNCCFGDCCRNDQKGQSSYDWHGTCCGKKNFVG